MSKGQKLISKLRRRERDFKEAKKDQYKKDKLQEVAQASPGAYRLMRKPQRRMDQAFGYNVIAQEPTLEYLTKASSMQRFDFDAGPGTDYGIRLTLSGTGYVAAVAEQTDITTVADVANSLNSKYMLIYTPTHSYYAWFNTGTGVDPALPGYTGVMVSIATNDASTAVASALQAALDALADMSATVLGSTVSAANTTGGAVADATSGNSGFTVSVTQQGVNESTGSLLAAIGVQPGDTVVIEQDGSALENRYLQVLAITDATHIRLDDVASFVGPESNVTVRFIISGQKKSYR